MRTGDILFGKQELPGLYLDPILMIRARYRHGRDGVKVARRGRQATIICVGYRSVRTPRAALAILAIIAPTAAAASPTSLTGKPMSSARARYWSGQSG